ncbi:iron-siderophore ABC transporter substrate-binding protein [Rhodococcoides kyotonense]|uniref:Iron complex transport system substrate-binding protein n=1 Tax=Rhodococcoides kyotonense TaxID=398843 RepID=A0A239NDQ7_9NOCA|nr:iron-siderophore ABC transporter substrate-binding protein [Rhodococcus kyotonensis]SNT53097.1 iron complex transport system substrate-binding protein [Rhodococcus kyotonensis]
MVRSARFLKFAAAAAAAAVVLSACSSSSDDSAAQTTSSGDGVFPVTVEHAFGETTVESEPKRVVVAGYTEQDTVLALGVKPVAVTEWYGEQPYATWPWAQDALGDATPEVLSADDGFQYERIAALNPDLIIATNAGLDQDSYTKLSELAPTIAQSGDFTEYFEPWDVQARNIGKALGKEAEVEEQIDAIADKFAAARSENPEFDGTKAIFLQNAFYDGAAIAYQNGLSTDFLTDLGFVVPSEIDQYATDGGGQANIPLENLSVLNAADVLLWGTETPEDRTTLEQEPVYQNLDAVKENKLVFTDGVTAGAIYFTSLLSLPYVIDNLTPAFASTLAGDGAATTES